MNEGKFYLSTRSKQIVQFFFLLFSSPSFIKEEEEEEKKSPSKFRAPSSIERVGRGGEGRSNYEHARYP